MSHSAYYSKMGGHHLILSFRQSCWLVLFVGLVLINRFANCGGHASIKSEYGQLVTSSTLKWKQFTQGQIQMSGVPVDGVLSGKGKKSNVVCRAEHHGTLLVGQTTSNGACEVAFVNKVYKKHRYEILLNLDRAAKLEWQPYMKYSPIPKGAIAVVDASEDTFLGRFLDADEGYLPGGIQIQEASYSFGSMIVFDGYGSVKEVQNGEVMVEIEPERYELKILENPNSRPKITRHDVVLAKSSLFRFDEGRDREARLQKVLSYDYDKSEYYGQVPGMIRALSTSVKLPNGQTHSILWGLPQISKQEETLMVGHSLRHQSAVDVSIVGVRIVEETSYKGILTLVFPGGAKRERKVEGLLQNKYLNNIRPEYSRVYRIKDTVVVSATPKHTTTPPSYWNRNHSKHQSWPTEPPKGQRDLMFSDQKSSDKASQSSAVILQSSGQGCLHGNAGILLLTVVQVSVTWSLLFS